MLRYAISGFAGVLLAIFAIVELYVMFRHGTQLLVPRAAALAMRAGAALPNIGVVAVVAALPVVAAYSLLQ